HGRRPSRTGEHRREGGSPRSGEGAGGHGELSQRRRLLGRRPPQRLARRAGRAQTLRSKHVVIAASRDRRSWGSAAGGRAGGGWGLWAGGGGGGDAGEGGGRK